MKNIFKFKDIRKFLLKEGYRWDGGIFNNSQKITVDIFEKPTTIELINQHNNRIGMTVVINNVTFKLMHAEYDFDGNFEGYYLFKNLSDEWMDYLLNQYKDYSSIVINYYNEETDKIKKELKQYLIPLRQEIQTLKENAADKLKTLNKLKQFFMDRNNTNTL